ncbi:regulator of G-protein signaling 2-like [Chanos chanos]|uniref:Regulator of G-protein signaling 2-like n=1 Tax=Chanos chanos TaxID=29144 RepID=A0A6J2W7D1_CHACN|nr:regulator of G-protein signaling 2-like [Chanos chanos]
MFIKQSYSSSSHILFYCTLQWQFVVSATLVKHLLRGSQSDRSPANQARPRGVSLRNWRSRIFYFLNTSSATAPSNSPTKLSRMTTEQVKMWAQSLDHLLSDKYGKVAFHIFLKSEFCEENIEFWMACEKFRHIKSPSKLRSKAKKIYEEFVKTESPKEVNLDFKTKEAILQALPFPDQSCFLTAQRRVFFLMENNSYTRFIQSELYRDLYALTEVRTPQALPREI